MTIRDLVLKLQEHPPETPIRLAGDSFDMDTQAFITSHSRYNEQFVQVDVTATKVHKYLGWLKV